MDHVKTAKRRRTSLSISEQHVAKRSASALNSSTDNSVSGFDDREEEDVVQEIRQRIELEMRVSELFGFKPRKEQVDCLQVLKAKKDLILLANTGFGKSVIFQANAYDDQAASINKRGGRWKACVLNATTKTLELLDKIRKGMYTHILLGAEVAVANHFAQVLKDPVFRRKLVLIAVDEAHVVEEWGKTFRTDYSRLAILRTRAATQGRVPFFATSATIDPDMLKDIKKTLGFQTMLL
ncbi:hypothetical protein ACJ73_01922 [Blastomyces percursus]|uniref:DNA 3'-5' helicase n=1 Tax=Blastomyces percursus TaxID=1658174 RepID=A0A1J9R2Q0_9EURO|nr:hypothetical protein ACJ73_01922 [Blastomyces percursus]